MAVTDQLKIIDNKIKTNQAQYDLDRLAATISAYSSGELRKYEHLTGEDLGYQLSVLEEKKFDYSPLGKVFTKGLDKDDQEEGIFKRLKNIEGKNEQQLKVIEDQRNKQLDATENYSKLKDDKAKNKTLLKDELKELIESYPNFFLCVKSELKQLATIENIDYKMLPQEIYFDGFSFFKRYSNPYILLKNLMTNKTSMNMVNDDQIDFVFDLTKGYNVSSFFKKSKTKDLDNRNLYERSKFKANDILLKCEKSTEGIKRFLAKRFKKDINEIQKVFY